MRFLPILALLLAGQGTVLSTCAAAELRLVIKYRSNTVDVDKPYFEYLDTSKSSWIRGAWYDAERRYMIINLRGTNYHYCGLLPSVWKKFKESDSFGSSYNANIKGNYDCRIFAVPSY
jgi:hypothetical protein